MVQRAPVIDDKTNSLIDDLRGATQRCTLAQGGLALVLTDDGDLHFVQKRFTQDDITALIDERVAAEDAVRRRILELSAVATEPLS